MAIANLVLVWLTSRYVLLTSRLVEETRNAREPLVTVDFEIPDKLLQLVIMNYGLSPAKNIKFIILKDASWIENDKDKCGFKYCAPFRDGLSYLTPNRKLKYMLWTSSWEDVPIEEKEISILIQYENDSGKIFKNIVNYNFCQMDEVMFDSFKDSNLAVAEAIQNAERDRQSRESTRKMLNQVFDRRKKCHMCAEFIPEEAKKCSRCLSEQDNSDRSLDQSG